MKLSDKAQASLNKVIRQFESGDLSPVTRIIRIRRKADDKLPAAKWSLANQVLALIQSGELDCRGFRQWEQAGRKVVKGASASYILGPMLKTVADDATGDEKTVVIGFRTIPVFPYSMTDGDELPAVEYTPAAMPPLVDVAERFGLKITYAPDTGRAAGWYSPGQRRIVLGTHNTPVFFHELAHAAHDRIGTLKGASDSQAETVAEFTAAILCDLYGVAHSGNAWEYIKGYAKDPLSAIYKALGTVEKVLGEILEDTGGELEL